MSEQTATNLRQATAKVNVEGILSEKVLEVKTEDGVKKIAGHLTIKTSDVNFIKFNVNVNEKTKEGKDNQIFASVMTIMNEYKSIAEVGEEAADRVVVRNGDINLYTTLNGNDVVAYKSNFFNRATEVDPKAEFEVEMYISAIVPEMSGEEETGRLLVKGWVPTFNGIEPIKLVADEDIAGDIEATFVPGQTVKFYGDVVNNRIETVVEKPVVIGKPKKDIKVTYRNDLLITSAEAPYDEDGAIKPYDMAVIKAAIQERTNRMEERKAQAAKPAVNARPSAASRGRSLGF